MRHHVSPARLAFAATLCCLYAAPSARGDLVSYQLDGYITGYGKNAAGYTDAELLATLDVRFAYDSTIAQQVLVNGNYVYVPNAQKKAYISLTIGGDTYAAGPDWLYGSIGIIPGATVDKMTIIGGISLTESFDWYIRYPTAGGALPTSLPASSFTGNAFLSELTLVRGNGDYYVLVLNNLRPAPSPFGPTPNPVPEPASAPFILAGLAVIAHRHRRACARRGAGEAGQVAGAGS